MWRSLINGDSGRCLDADTHTIGSNSGKVQLWDYRYALNPVPLNQQYQAVIA